MRLSSAGSPANGAGLCLIFFATQLRGCFNNGADYEFFALETPMVCGPAVGDGQLRSPDPDFCGSRLVSDDGLRGFHLPGERLVFVKTPSSPAPMPPDADKPREVCRYRNMQILDCRERIQVVITGEPPRGVRWTLKNEGFNRRNNTTWEAPNTPITIMAAQAIGSTFFEEQETP